jgi:leucine efflux protein
MLGITDLGTYALGAFLIVLLPGPNSLYVASVAARKGIRTGYQAAAAVFVGDIILMVLSAAGVASLLKANEALYAVVKYTGGAYLAWLGIGMLRSAWGLWRERRLTLDVPAAEAPDQPSAERPFRRALVVSLLNPKAILFFISFFIQFVDPGYPHPALSFLLLGVILTAFSALYLSTLIFTGTYLAGQFRRRRRLSAGLTSAVGALFMAFAAKLALSSAG